MNNIQFIDFFKAQLTDDVIVLSLETVYGDIPDWDSLTAMLLITNLKDEFSIEISSLELQNCKTLADILSLINTK